MKVEDCEINVRCLIPRGIVGRRELLNHQDINFVNGKTKCIISKVYSDKTCKIRYLNTLEVQKVKIKYLELVNKFKVGDEILFNNSCDQSWEGKIWGIANKKDARDDCKYGIEINRKGVINNLLAKESNLSPRKKQDELDVGDKFRDYASKIVKVLAAEYCESKNKVIYFGKKDNGFVGVWSEVEVEEIIYD